MVYNTEKNKLFKLWNKTNNNSNIIINQKDVNHFIIENINELNKKNQSLPVLFDFSTDWITPNTLISTDGQRVLGNYLEFRLIFNNIDLKVIPYIHSEVVYRVGTSGIIPLVNNFPPPPEQIPFDEDLASSSARFVTNEIFKIDEDIVEYISSVRMKFVQTEEQEVQYKFICYISNPHYYQST